MSVRCKQFRYRMLGKHNSKIRVSQLDRTITTAPLQRSSNDSQQYILTVASIWSLWHLPDCLSSPESRTPSFTRSSGSFLQRLSYKEVKYRIYSCLFFIFYWNIVDLQCYVSFRCTAKWFSYKCLVSFPLQEKILNIVRGLYRRSLLMICVIYSGLYI